MYQFSTLAGRLQNLPRGQKYTVRFIDLKSYDSFIYRKWISLAAIASLLLVLIFEVVLFLPDHWIVNKQPDSSTHWANWTMLIYLMVLQLFVMISTFSCARSTLKAKDPEPVRAKPNLKVAFVTTRAPGEPISMVKTTLQAIKKVRYKAGKIDAWLLDETNNDDLKAICKSFGVRHFSRVGKKAWNTEFNNGDARFASKTKHGNFNAWLQHLKNKNISYDILAGVDTDHVPEPNYLERTLGYFRDPDVAFVVGPQVYGNYRSGLEGQVSRWAESQASFFQSTIQRAGNASASPMFVGTNYTIRVDALDQIGGFQPCITEDMATGLAIHTRRNPVTGKRWKSVYTPDVLAVGEGPDFWGPYFTQQWRWAAGTFDTWRRVVWKVFYKLSPSAMTHYFLMLTYYPITALTWLLGILSSMTYLITGATAILAPLSYFISLYLMTLIMQLSLYFWNRRYNVSPHEPEGSFGMSGMALSALAAPVYLSALRGVIFGKKPRFVVTKKGSTKNSDRLSTFKIHVQWAILLLVGLMYGLTQGHNNPAMMVWVATQLVLCVTPIIAWLSLVLPERREEKKLLISERVSHA